VDFVFGLAVIKGSEDHRAQMHAATQHGTDWQTGASVQRVRYGKEDKKRRLGPGAPSVQAEHMMEKKIRASW